MEAKQVKFYLLIEDEPEMMGGILIDNRFLICGCCGGMWDLEYDPYEVCIVKVYDEWMNLSNEIIGDD